MNFLSSKNPVDIIIAGAQKAATSSLQNYIGEHPDVVTHFSKEFTYFALDEEFSEGYESIYQKHFNEAPNTRKVLAKNVGIMYWEHALIRLKQHNPNVKIIIVLRNPVDRAYSAYWFARSKGHEENETFEEALNAKPDRFSNIISSGFVDYIGRGEYANQIEMIYRFFNKSQVLILTQDEMKTDLKKIIKSVFEFCDLESSFVPDLSRKYNESSKSLFPAATKWLLRKNTFVKLFLKQLLPASNLKKARKKFEKLNSTKFVAPPMKVETRNQLISIFKPHNDRLETILGRDLDFWNK